MGTTTDGNTVIRRVRVLQGRARDIAIQKGYTDKDLVLVKTSINSLPSYDVQRIDGDPLSFLLNRKEQK
jgi:hypothetical protein